MSVKIKSLPPLNTVGHDDRHQDPFWHILQPPPNETPEERTVRLQKQQDAQRISREIDESIQESKKAFDRRRKAVKILLLGQAESGKSTTLKNFQLAFAPTQFRRERAAWKIIIQLNLIGSVKKLLVILSEELDQDARERRPSVSSPTAIIPSILNDSHRRLRMRLSPLLSIETSLAQKLLPEMSGGGSESGSPRGRDLCVRAGSGWKEMLERVTTPPPVKSEKRPFRPGTGDPMAREDPTLVLAACKDDIITLWYDPAMRALLRRGNIRMELSPGFFLDDIARIADLEYEPTDSDIVRARLRTYGVEEHRLTMETGAGAGSEYYMIDVGGSRFQRPQWVPYFDDVTSIIFLAPLAFNQVLEEDPKVNRLQDSIHLWQEVCSSRLLANATIILFLNKMDILQANLEAGVRVQKFVPSYGNAPNDIQSVTKYFKDKFNSYLKRLSPKSRSFFCHETSAIDTKATKAILVGVQEGILRTHLEKTSMI